MTKKERVLAAINCEEPDKVPKGELIIAPELTIQLLGEKIYKKLGMHQSEIEVRNLLNIDIAMAHDFPTTIVGVNSEGCEIYLSPFGDQFIDSGKSTHMVKPALDNIMDAKVYKIPDISWCTTTNLDYYVKNSDFFIMAQIGGPVANAQLALGMENYMIEAMINTKEMKMFAEKIMDFELERAKIFIDHGADSILMADDIAFNDGVFLPPHIMEEVAYPIYKKLVHGIKKYGNVPVIMHSDGYMYDVIPKIIECGFNGLQSLQPSAGMDIEKIKHNYGSKLCLMGNIDLDYLLTFGKPEEVEAEVKRVIDIAGSGGGFILSTCNMLTDSVKPENALAMYRTAERHGYY